MNARTAHFLSPLGRSAMADKPIDAVDRRSASCVGQQVGKYALRRVIGSGGMGLVYEAEDAVLGRSVAVKMLRDDLAADPLLVQRFMLEAQATARLCHANVVTLHDVVETDGHVLIVMEMIRGGNADELLNRQGPLDWRTATRITVDACRGLVAAHQAGLVHRDIKPSNIMLTSGATDPAATAKLADFGLAKYHRSGGTALTDAGTSLGTPHFMSPEQCRAEAPDHRSDVYSLGATYFKLLTGRFPFEGEQVVQILFAHCSAAVPELAALNPGVDPRCQGIVDRAMAKQPHERFQTAGQMLVELEALLNRPNGDTRGNLAETVVPGQAAPTASAARRKRWPLRGGLAVVVLLVVIAWSIGMPPRWAGSPDSGADTTTDPHYINVDGVMGTMEVRGDGAWMAWGVSDRSHASARLLVRDLQSGQVRVVREEKRRYARFAAAAFLPASDLLVAAERESLRIVDTGASLDRPLVAAIEGTVRDVASHPGGGAIAVAVDAWADAPDRVVMYGISTAPEVELGDARSVLPGDLSDVSAVAFSPNGNYLAVADGNLVYVVDGRAGELQMTFELPASVGRQEGVGCVPAFSPDSRLLAVSGARGIVMWSLQNGRRVELPAGHRDPISVIAFHPAGNVIAAASPDGIRLWHVASGDQLGEPLDGHGGHVISDLAFANEGRTLVSAGFDNAIRFWDLSPVLQESPQGAGP